jgi:Fe-S oxidoreductase
LKRERQAMDSLSFEAALGERVGQMADACTRCGKCVEVCPSVRPAGIAGVKAEDVIAGVIEIVRTGDGPDASRRWASSCMLSGDCVKACDYGANPRFMLAMARVAMQRHERELPERRREGVQRYRELSRDVTVLSQLQLSDAVLERLGQKTASVSKPEETPDFVFYTGCNVLKTPHIALLALDVMDTLGISYQVMGGPTHCCGILQMQSGDVEVSGRMGSNSIEKLSRSKTGQVLSWCPSCYVQYTESTIPAIERQHGSRPFEITPFIRFLRSRLSDLIPHLRNRVQLRIALHKHPGVAGLMEAAADLLRAVPGVEIIDLQQPAVGLQSVSLKVLPEFKRELQLKELEAARDAGVDALVAVYHSDHRELCAHERDWPFRIMHRHDRFKELKMMQDADLILAECQDMLAKHDLDADLARKVVVKAMLGEQPLPLMGGSRPTANPGNAQPA